MVEVREASERGDWQAVADALTSERERLGPDELELLGHAVWWLGDTPRSMAVAEDAYQRLRSSGDDDRAAEVAMRLALQWVVRGDVPVAEAWLARAVRLLAQRPECPLHGYLRYLQGLFVFEGGGDPSAAAEDLTDLAGRHADPALGCFALTLRGLAAIADGRTAEGFAHLDEAMLPVLAGRVGDIWAGDLHCSVIHQCEQLSDLARMRAWTAALSRWSAPMPPSFVYAEVTRVHELQLLAAEGEWDTVEAELGRHSDGLVGAHGWLAGEGMTALGDVRRLRGDGPGAEAAYARARELGHDPQPGAALLAHAEGRSAEALADLRVALAERGRLQRARLLPALVDIALQRGSAAEARRAASELAETAAWCDSPGLRAEAAVAGASVLLAQGDGRAAIEALGVAERVFRDQRHRHGSARVHELLARAHHLCGDPERTAASRATAVAIYRHLGAAPDLARMEPGARPGGLTAREAEVLTVLVTGASNHDIAQSLSISDKTVSRHLANIFTKLDVGSRTAAAAWARDHGW